MPIGDYATHTDNVYRGAFDGAGHTVSGVYTKDREKSYQGLFGYSMGAIRNVNVVNSFICGSENVGGICGFSAYFMEKCSNYATVAATNDVGGICGQFGGFALRDCYNAGAFYGAYYFGGICGEIANGGISNCYNVGTNIRTGAAGSICSGTGAYNCYYLGTVSDNTEGTVPMTQAQFASGEVCSRLNNGVCDGTQTWYQTIGTDAIPLFEGSTVYYDANREPCYSNDEPVYWTVEYFADGSKVASLSVRDGETLSSIPAVPAKEGYSGKWETSLSGVAIKQNYTVNALYTINTYTVTYVADGETVGEYTVDWNKTLTEIPAVPEKKGWTASWDADLSGVAITQNYTVNAVYGPRYGDANCDNSVNAADAAAVLRHVVKLIKLSDQGLINAKVTLPVNGNNELSAGDAAAILRYTVHLIIKFAVEE